MAVTWLHAGIYEDGLCKSHLMQFYESIRCQRNIHRASIGEHVRTALAVILPITIFQVSATVVLSFYCANHVFSSSERFSWFVIAVVVSLTIFAGQFIFFRAIALTVKKEYSKVIEYLTVEQKLQCLIGYAEPLKLKFPAPENLPFSDDESVLYPRWIQGMSEGMLSERFLDSIVARKMTFFKAYFILIWMALILSALMLVWLSVMGILIF